MSAFYHKLTATSSASNNVSLAATTNFIREIAAATGAAADAAGVAPLIAVQRERLGSVPPYLLYDQAAGTPKTYAEVAKASHGQTQLAARLIDYTKRREHFGPQDFTLEGGPNGTRELICPNGVRTSRAYPSGAAEGYNFRFLASQCQGCPLWAQCRDPKSKPQSHRNVFISNYQLEQRHALAFTKTAEFKALMKLRPEIERIIAALVRYNGARRAKATGVDSADFQAKMAAVAYNRSAELTTKPQTLAHPYQRKEQSPAQHRVRRLTGDGRAHPF